MDLEIRLCKADEEEASWDLERKVWNPFNWKARGGAGTDYFPELHLLAFLGGELVGTADACPMHWDGRSETLPSGGWSEMVRGAHLWRQEPKERPQWAGAIGTSILPEAKGKGVALELLRSLKVEALANGYQGMAAPVRPVYRPRAPWCSIEEYAALRLPSGEHFDPWVRIHEEIGGVVEGTCSASARWLAPREDWEEWTGVGLPENGTFLLRDTIGPLEIKGGEGLLREESIWLIHR